MPDDPPESASEPAVLSRDKDAQSRRRDVAMLDGRDRSALSLLWYRMVQWYFSTVLAAIFGLRATGRRNIP